LFECVGSELTHERVPEQVQFYAASVPVQHLIGVASQVDVIGRLDGAKETDRSAFLKSTTVELLSESGADRFPFLDHEMSPSPVAHRGDVAKEVCGQSADSPG